MTISTTLFKSKTLQKYRDAFHSRVSNVKNYTSAKNAEHRMRIYTISNELFKTYLKALQFMICNFQNISEKLNNRKDYLHFVSRVITTRIMFKIYI